MKRNLVSIKNHIKNNRAKYASMGTAIAFLALMRRNGQMLNEFLLEHDIDPAEYYLPEE